MRTFADAADDAERSRNVQTPTLTRAQKWDGVRPQTVSSFGVCSTAALKTDTEKQTKRDRRAEKLIKPAALTHVHTFTFCCSLLTTQVELLASG